MMNIDYAAYYRACFSSSVMLALFSGFFAFSVLIPLIKTIFSKERPIKNILGGTVVLMVPVFLLSLNIGTLAHGGIYLATEKETDAVEIHGTIEHIERMNEWCFPKMKGYCVYERDGSNGICFTIDGVKYQCPSMGDFRVGDRVTVVYLPKSKYILSLAFADE